MTELDFVADGWYQITGRGWAAYMSNVTLPGSMKPGDLLSRYVRIDGKEYWVAGVETQGYVTDRFALLIRGEK
jgi:hypothetical protein